MKISKLITIDYEVNHQLNIRHIKNVSSLINDLLKNYLQINEDEFEVKERQIEEELIKKQAEISKLEQQKALYTKKREEEAEKLKDEIESGNLVVIE